VSFGNFGAAGKAVERTAATSAKVLAPYLMAARRVTRSGRSNRLVVILKILHRGMTGEVTNATRQVSRGRQMPYQIRPGSRVVTSWTSQVLPSGSLKEKNDP
jgi:hypothetical protein